jgi:hypothetical protein
MTAFKKFDPQAFLEGERLAPTLATLATLAASPPKNEIRRAASKIVSEGDIRAVSAKNTEPQRGDGAVIHDLDPLGKNQNQTPTPAKAAKAAKDENNFSNFSSPAPSKTEYDHSHYASALAALRAKCPAYVPKDRWRQAVADATTFATKWGAEAEASGWTAPELFGLNRVPEQPAPNYDRVARVNEMGLVWLLRNRPVVELTETTAAYRCANGSILTYYRRTAPAAPAPEIADAVEPIGKPTPMTEIGKASPAKQIDSAVALYRPAEAAIHAMAQIGKPTPVGVIDSVAIATQDPVSASRSVSDAPKAALGHRSDDLLTTATPTPEAAP